MSDCISETLQIISFQISIFKFQTNLFYVHMHLGNNNVIDMHVQSIPSTQLVLLTIEDINDKYVWKRCE